MVTVGEEGRGVLSSALPTVGEEGTGVSGELEGVFNNLCQHLVIPKIVS